MAAFYAIELLRDTHLAYRKAKQPFCKLLTLKVKPQRLQTLFLLSIRIQNP